MVKGRFATLFKNCIPYVMLLLTKLAAHMWGFGRNFLSWGSFKVKLLLLNTKNKSLSQSTRVEVEECL
jgi:hypothetical protein